jgi:hypothetical protein
MLGDGGMQSSCRSAKVRDAQKQGKQRKKSHVIRMLNPGGASANNIVVQPNKLRHFLSSLAKPFALRGVCLSFVKQRTFTRWNVPKESGSFLLKK